MKRLDEKGKKDHVKKLWKESPFDYFEFKQWGMENNYLSDFFGTVDDPILIDESKL